MPVMDGISISIKNVMATSLSCQPFQENTQSHNIFSKRTNVICYALGCMGCTQSKGRITYADVLGTLIFIINSIFLRKSLFDSYSIECYKRENPRSICIVKSHNLHHSNT